MSTRSKLHILSRVIYNSLYLFLSLILLLLLCVTPADAIRQSYNNQQRFHILIIIICLSVTLVVVVLIYMVRLYVNRTTLANIPKNYIPIDKGDVRKKVRRMIVASLSRSAAIAYESRPRVAPTAVRPPTTTAERDGEAEEGKGKEKEKEKEKDAQGKRRSTLGIFGLNKAPTVEEKMGITLPPHKAVWGGIEHYGWASPTSPDLPNLQYSTVISELPNLIEAKALTLAPPAPSSSPGELVLDPEATALLQRSENMALRQYLAQLAELGVLAASRTTADFLSGYDYARYSTRPISNARFRELMHHFAEILRTMNPLDPAILTGLDGAYEDDVSSESDIDNDAPRRSPSTPRSQPSQHSLHRQRSTASRATTTTTSSFSSRNSRGSQIRSKRLQHAQHIQRANTAARNSSHGTWAGTYRTAPTTPKSRRSKKAAPSELSRTSSLDSFAQTRQPYSVSQDASSVSLGSSVVSGGSVIRLSERADATGLPYVLALSDTNPGG